MPYKPARPVQGAPMAEALKADLFEQLGTAFNASALDLHPTHERAVERIAALGASAAEVASGADLQGLTLAAVQGDVYRASMSMRDLMLDPGTPDARDVIAGELGPKLLHILHGGQAGLVPSAIPLLAQWLRHRRLFSAFTLEQQPLLERFAGCVLQELTSHTCPVCGGSGRLELSGNGTPIRALGRGQRNARFVLCRTKKGAGCGGSGRARPSPVARARWLGITLKAYDEDDWAQRFSASLAWVQYLIIGRLKRPLTAQLERRKKRL